MDGGTLFISFHLFFNVLIPHLAALVQCVHSFSSCILRTNILASYLQHLIPHLADCFIFRPNSWITPTDRTIDP